ncbi:glutathione S-transferase family protein [Pseudoroseicyclus aestuarii]|uniref:Glutathione S-transferase n=1 Tax=Pseudoroseicyclus aestuarii TaxID=1795041 RepID=A0A318SVJ2_9RHOB|nr:glutathione S-transferase family protein [Pseudoroseicyclus aestuarii]PYE85931.1 glutathione S-transferase [Pseudoroseicyclus aestuarii]
MTAQLTCFGESGNAYKAALTMQLSDYAWEAVPIDFFRGAGRSADFLALNEMGEVPVLVDGDVTLSQSCVIQLHVAERTGKLLAEDRAEMLRWMFWDAHKGSSQQGTLRFQMNFLPEEKRSAEVIAFLTGRVQAALATLDRHLEARDWITGDVPSLADTACCGYLYYPEPFGFDAGSYPAIAAWLDRIAALPGWRHPYDLMPRALPGAA